MGFFQTLGQLTLHRFVQIFKNPKKAIRNLIRVGLNYGRIAMGEDAVYYADVKDSVAGIEDLSGADVIPRQFMVETTLKRDRLYRVYGYSDYYNPDTGLTDRVFTSFYSNQGVNEIEWEAEFTEQYEEKWGEDYNRKMVGFETVFVEHNKGRGYAKWEDLREL